MLEFQNISINEKDKLILDDLVLTVPEGAILGLLGEDDEAKTTLLACAAGHQAPDRGQVLLNGRSVYEPKNKTHEQLGYMPGKYGFYDLLRVEEYYDLFLSLYRINGRYRQRRIEEVLEQVALSEYASVFVGEMPTEKLPFLCLGKTILHNPGYILLDEPFANMNIAAREEMARMLFSLQEEGKTILMHSQMFPELPALLTDVAVIEEGRVVTSGPIDAVYDAARKKVPVRMCVLSGMDDALQVLKMHPLVERVTVDGSCVIFRFNGEEHEEAKLLTQLTFAGALVQNYMRSPVNPEQIFRG